MSRTVDFSQRSKPGRHGEAHRQRLDGDYAEEVTQFILAVDRAKQQARLPVLPASMIFEVMIGLGYRRLSDALLAQCATCRNCGGLYVRWGPRAKFCSLRCSGRYAARWRAASKRDWPSRAAALLTGVYPAGGADGARQALLKMGYEFSVTAVRSKAKRLGLRISKAKAKARTKGENHADCGLNWEQDCS